MTANELRIGNYVWDEENEVRRVIELSRTLISTSCDCIILASEVKPIPLTEEILLKCGFIKLDKSDYFFIHGYQMNFKVSGDLKMVAWHNLAIHDVCIKHLHQLQNLFYALTGQELEVKV